MSVILATWGSTNRKIVVQAGPDTKQDPLPKITNVKRFSGMTQMLEDLSSKYEGLSSIPN
jgi:hypothetical protein